MPVKKPIVDPYINDPLADKVLDSTNVAGTIPEIRIAESCIDYVTEKLGYKKEYVEAIHNFQWK